jgi:hypothetical protein
MTVIYKGPITLIGLSTDTKPLNVTAGTRFYVKDFGFEEYIFDGVAWNTRLSIEADRFYDDFEAGTFSFTDGSTSPNNKWKNKFISGGTSGVRTVSGDNVMWLRPQVSTSAPQTSSVVNYTVNDLFQDFELTCRMRTISQIRTGSAPNSWETAWLIWRIGDINGQMGYYFVIKTNGCEFGKSDNIDSSQSNYILATPGSPTCTMGQWYNVKVRVEGSHHKVWVDDVLVVDYEDISPKDAPLPSRMIQRAGHIALYCEDAEVEFNNVRVLPLYPKSLLDYEQQAHNTTPLPSSNRKSGAFYGTTAASGDNLLSGILTNLGASNAQVIDDLGIHRSYTTGTSTGNQAGLSTNVALFRRSHNLVLRAKIKTPSTTASNHIWVGFSSSSTIGNNDDPLNTFHGMIVGYRSGSSIWGVLGNNAQATDTVQAENLTLTANEWVNIYMELQSTGKCVVRLNNRTPLTFTTSTVKPGPSTNMYLHCLLTTTTTAARTLTIDHLEIETSPGNDVIV